LLISEQLFLLYTGIASSFHSSQWPQHAWDCPTSLRGEQRRSNLPAQNKLNYVYRHCEERSDEATSQPKTNPITSNVIARSLRRSNPSIINL